MDNQDKSTQESRSDVGGARTIRAPWSFPASFKSRYEILAEAGHGGMGVVYKAKDKVSGDTVALKLLHSEIANQPDLLERFRSELLLARRITHKNVSRVYDLNEFDDLTVISMEYVQGENLRDLLRRVEGLSVRHGMKISGQVIAGLEEAHSQGVVHRDLKPANIMIAHDGTVKIMDFGLARSLDADKTRTDGLVGTPAYVSPEQARGVETDVRSDIYSLGLVLYEMFSGQRAFDAETPLALLRMQIDQAPAPLRSIAPDLPARIERVVSKCIEKNPEERFQDLSELRDAMGDRLEAKEVGGDAREEVRLPSHLKLWQRSDWLLLASALVATATLFSLMFLFHPAVGLEITIDRQQQDRVVNDALGGLGLSLQIEEPRLWFAPRFYYLLARGTRPLGRDLAARAGITGWEGRLVGTSPEGEGIDGSYAMDGVGNLLSVTVEAGLDPQSHVWRPVAPADRRIGQGVSDARSSFDSDSEARTRIVEAARTTIGALFGTAPTSSEPGIGEWASASTQGVFLIWDEFEDPGVRRYAARVTEVIDESRWKLVNVRQELQASSGPPNVFGRLVPGIQGPVSGYYSDPNRVFGRYILAFFGVTILAVVLFLVRKVYLQERSRENLALATLIAVAAALASMTVEYGGPGGDYLNVTMPLLVISLGLPVTHGALSAVLYYLRKRCPFQVATYLSLSKANVLSRPVGLALLRGAFYGLLFAGTWMALMSVGMYLGAPQIGMISWLQFFSQPETVVATMVWGLPLFLLAHGVLIVWFFIAFPLGLLDRLTSRQAVSLGVLVAVWLAFGLSSMGAVVFPVPAFYVLAALQCVLLGWLLRYGILESMSTAITVEVMLLVVPLLAIFRALDPWPYLITIGMWFLLLVVAGLVYLRPQLLSAYRRVAEVFD